MPKYRIKPGQTHYTLEPRPGKKYGRKLVKHTEGAIIELSVSRAADIQDKVERVPDEGWPEDAQRESPPEAAADEGARLV